MLKSDNFELYCHPGPSETKAGNEREKLLCLIELISYINMMIINKSIFAIFRFSHCSLYQEICPDRIPLLARHRLVKFAGEAKPQRDPCGTKAGHSGQCFYFYQ
jgi:hypothetical protein